MLCGTCVFLFLFSIIVDVLIRGLLFYKKKGGEGGKHEKENYLPITIIIVNNIFYEI